MVDEDGPYDGVIGFSQSAALAASFLLSHEARRRTAGPVKGSNFAFKVAVFLNSVMLFSPSEDIGSDISEEIARQEDKHRGFLESASSSPLYSSTCSTPFAVGAVFVTIDIIDILVINVFCNFDA